MSAGGDGSSLFPPLQEPKVHVPTGPLRRPNLPSPTKDAQEDSKRPLPSPSLRACPVRCPSPRFPRAPFPCSCGPSPCTWLRLPPVHTSAWDPRLPLPYGFHSQPPPPGLATGGDRTEKTKCTLMGGISRLDSGPSRRLLASTPRLALLGGRGSPTFLPAGGLGVQAGDSSGGVCSEGPGARPR